MPLVLPKYNSKDHLVLAIIIVPYTILLNSVILGPSYFILSGFFVKATLITAVLFSVNFAICSAVGVLLKNRFSNELQDNVRMTAMIIIFLLISGLYLFLLFHLFIITNLIENQDIGDAFIWAFIGQAIINIFLTFLMEGISRFEKWKLKLDETHQLQHYYQQGQMQGLKSQVNPHFLFNSLNSLSSLISENEDEAEEFLNEMSKVYRYMLRNDGDHLVPLIDEMEFLRSYFHLLKARYGDSICLEISIPDELLIKTIPPLALQTIVENAYSLNAFSKKEPLVFRIYSENNDILFISNTVKPKMLTENLDFDSGLDLLVKKYKAFGQQELQIRDEGAIRIISIPLITSKKEVL